MSQTPSGSAVTVILNTYNRAGVVTRSLDALAAQTLQEFDIVVVDDGSDDDTADVLSRVSEPRIRVVRHENMGLTASRNAGAEAASGEWLAFLDDDDIVEPDWLETLVAATSANLGIVFCGHTRVTPEGEVLESWSPRPMGRMFGGVEGAFWPGTWLMSRQVFEHCGRYMDGLPFIHQYELLLRALRSCRDLGLEVATLPDPLLRYTVRSERDRPMLWPQLALDGGRWVLVRHRSALDDDRPALADLAGVIGVAAARCGRPQLARRFLWMSVRSAPNDPKRWLRWVTSSSKLLSRRVWGLGTAPSGQLPPLPRVHSLPPERRRGEDHLFLPWGYARNPQASSDSEGSPYWEEPSMNNVLFQEPVYRWAARLLRRSADRRVIDVGTGSGVKLRKIVAPVAKVAIGMDQGSGIEIARSEGDAIEWIEGDLGSDAPWAQLVNRQFDLVICADVVEHVEDPVDLLRRLHGLIESGGRLLISTPDRLWFDTPSFHGPPSNPRHVREWTSEEFELLLESAGFRVLKQRRLFPRGYRRTVGEFKRIVWRILHGKAVPDHRTNMAFLCRSAHA